MIAYQPAFVAESTARTTGGLTLTLHAASDRQRVLTIWRELEQTLSAVPLMCSADWTEVWLNHFGAITQHRFAVWHDGERPVAAALLPQNTQDRDGLVKVHAVYVGTSGEADDDSVCVEYNALLCNPAHHCEVWHSLLNALANEPEWDELRLNGFAAHELENVFEKPRECLPWVFSNSAKSPGEGIPWDSTECTWHWDRKPARYVDLNVIRESGRELIEFFGNSTRKGIRQNLRRYGQISIEWAENSADATEIFSELMTLHQRRWEAKGKRGCYASPVFTAFHRELLERLVPQKKMVLFRTRSNGETLACSQLLIDRGRVLLYQGGRQHGDSKHSPGLVNDYLAIQSALERGFAAFDFMAGDSVHKQRLSTHAADLTWGVCRRPRLKFAVMDRLRDLRQWLKAMRTHV